MADRLDRIEAITESNARAIAAHAEAQSEFANRFDSFIQRMDQRGLQVTLIQDITDDQADELAYTREGIEDNDIRINALRADAVADRQAFREALIEERQRSDQRFEAMQENLQQLFRELIRTNNRVESLERAS